MPLHRSVHRTRLYTEQLKMCWGQNGEGCVTCSLLDTAMAAALMSCCIHGHLLKVYAMSLSFHHEGEGL